MKQTLSANRNSNLVTAGRNAVQQRRLTEMRRALVQGESEPVSLVVARFFTAA